MERKINIIRSLLCIGMLASFGVLAAQNIHHVWLRTTLSYQHNNRFSISGEIQHRTQNDTDTGNPFAHPLLSSGRLWLQYRTPKDIAISLSPAAWFTHYRLVESGGETTTLASKEFRTSAAAAVKKKIGEHAAISLRNSVEYRVFDSPVRNVLRWRTRLGIRYALNAHLVFSVSEEILLNFTGVSEGHLFDQNRIGLFSEFKFSRNIAVELGYLGITRLPGNSDQSVWENNYVVQATYTIVRKSQSQ